MLDEFNSVIIVALLYHQNKTDAGWEVLLSDPQIPPQFYSIIIIAVLHHQNKTDAGWEVLMSDPQIPPSLARGTRVQRTKSMVEFQELMKNDATSALHYELSRLAITAPPEKRQVRLHLFMLASITNVFKNVCDD